MSGITDKPHVGLLSTYIEHVYGRTPLMYLYSTMDRPTCKQNSGKIVNEILVYPGSFDPPHRGHLELLTHVFHHRDGIIAVIVIPLDDDDI